MYNMIEDVAVIGAVPLTPYGTPSTSEVPDAIEPYLDEHDVMLLENHGALAVGSDVITAFYRMESLELWAKITINAIILGGLIVDPDVENDSFWDSAPPLDQLSTAGHPLITNVRRDAGCLYSFTILKTRLGGSSRPLITKGWPSPGPPSGATMGNPVKTIDKYSVTVSRKNVIHA